jgi:hypothetical protein
MRTSRTQLIAVVIGLLLAVFTPSASAAATRDGNLGSGPDTAPQLTVHKGSRAADSTSSSCDVIRGGKLGKRICEYDWFDYTWSDGRRHTFIIGLNYAVYNIVEYAGGGTSGWASLGGSARNGVYLDYLSSPSYLSIWVYGSNYLPYCRGLNGSWAPGTPVESGRVRPPLERV